MVKADINYDLLTRHNSRQIRIMQREAFYVLKNECKIKHIIYKLIQSILLVDYYNKEMFIKLIESFYLL
jgi:hypothetical protein